MYSPSYLISKSNQLFSQHQKRLNGIAYSDVNVVQQNPQVLFSSVIQHDPENPASVGQIYQATQETIIPSSTQPSNSIINDIQPNYSENESNRPTFAHLRHLPAENLIEQPLQYTSSNDLSNNYNTYQELIQRQLSNGNFF